MGPSDPHKRPLTDASPWERRPKESRTRRDQESPHHDVAGRSMRHGGSNDTFQREQARLNQIQEAEQMREWVAKEDEFVLEQSKKKAHIRAKDGRAKAIDWLAVALGLVSIDKDTLEDDADEVDMDVVDPFRVLEDLDQPQLKELEQDIDAYLGLEKRSQNRNYWKSLKTVCRDYQSKFDQTKAHSRGHSTVSADIDKLLKPKTLPELTTLEGQIHKKLESDEPMDYEYWEQLLRNVGVFKARAELRDIRRTIVASRLQKFRQEQCSNAIYLGRKLELVLSHPDRRTDANADGETLDRSKEAPSRSDVKYLRGLDPESRLKLQGDDKQLECFSEKTLLETLRDERSRIVEQAYIPNNQVSSFKQTVKNNGGSAAAVAQDDFASATDALYNREVARGIQDDEEIFAAEEDVITKSKSQWTGKYRPRKPRYFNRVQMGYEWNKYNQTHYDHDNPPPKVVQGYKFNVFYPDLIDKTKAPTYRIEREGGRRRGETSAPAGEEDTCLIRFMSGPPYEDIGFKIVDKEWDFSAKRERGFRSSFDKGILQLHFQFKKVYYRK